MFKKQKKLIPVSLLTGYLGAGKTTVLNHVLSNQQGYKVAVIVNDIGEVNIDASLIAKGGAVTQKDENLVPLQNGCICCTLKVDLMKQIVELARSGKFDYIPPSRVQSACSTALSLRRDFLPLRVLTALLPLSTRKDSPTSSAPALT